eukprot:TRINITY_DN4599_c0_g1_i1.p2 TRINITY_DN4599_c0_g1~~TRINITY_DN4599_c0_g1_i1.p2  ORF type:complete len:111 (+),score=58.25 TRINITY_DN4599_c0_g1_i1:37-333(+)
MCIRDRQYPDDYEKFCEIRDKIMLQPDVNLFSKECDSCQSKEHNIFKCQLFAYCPDQTKVLLKYWYRNKQDRQYVQSCLLYTSPSPRDKRQSRMPSSA